MKLVNIIFMGYALLLTLIAIYRGLNPDGKVSLLGLNILLALAGVAYLTLFIVNYKKALLLKPSLNQATPG